MQTISIDQASARRTFHSLDGLRGVAAICVVMLHYGLYILPFSIGSGYLAVDLFFVISGFVLGFAYEDRLTGTMSPGRFFLLRFVRLYPLYALGTSLAIVVPLAGLAMHVSRVWTWQSLALSAVPAMLMLPGPGQAGEWDLLYILNFPAWSLFFELIANVAYAVLLRTGAGRMAQALVIGAGCACLAAVGLHGNVDSGPDWSVAWVSLARVGFSFGVGVYIFRLYRDGRLPVFRVPPMLVMAIVALVLIASPPTWARGLYDVICVFILFPLCVVACVVNEVKAGVKVFVALGLISYPIYVIHLPASYVLSRACDHLLGTNATSYAPWIGIGMIAALAAVSLLLARYVDPWARAFLTRRLINR